MSKYEQYLSDLKNNFSQIQSVGILLPSNLTVDKLAAGLSLMLALKNAGKSVTIVSEGTPTVSYTNLFGVGDLQKLLTVGGDNNLTLVLENVVSSDGTVPALEKLDWYPEGSNLNLVFHVLPGQKFEPSNIRTNRAESGMGLVFTIGVSNLGELGSVYTQNMNFFSTANIVNIDLSLTNGNFGKVNIVDNNAASISEIVFQVIQDLGLSIDGDIATNIIAGIYEATSNMTTNLKPDAFNVVAQALQLGGKLPAQMTGTPQTQAAAGFSMAEQPVSSPTVEPGQNANPFLNVPQTFGNQNSTFQPVVQSTPVVDVSSVASQVAPPAFNFGVQTQPNSPIDSSLPPFMQQPPVVTPNNSSGNQSSTEERPMGEFVGSPSPEAPSNPAPDWLTPKIFKGNA